jgi:hypothetical protein
MRHSRVKNYKKWFQCDTLMLFNDLQEVQCCSLLLEHCTKMYNYEFIISINFPKLIRDFEGKSISLVFHRMS